MMANEMDGLEEDAAMSEIDFLCQENNALRGRLEELTKELADSEEKRVILPQEMYKLPPSVLLFVMSDVQARNGTKSELTRIRNENTSRHDENNSLKRMVSPSVGEKAAATLVSAKTSQMSDMSITPHFARAVPIKVDIDTATESIRMEFTDDESCPRATVEEPHEQHSAVTSVSQTTLNFESPVKEPRPKRLRRRITPAWSTVEAGPRQRF